MDRRPRIAWLALGVAVCAVPACDDDAGRFMELDRLNTNQIVGGWRYDTVPATDDCAEVNPPAVEVISRITLRRDLLFYTDFRACLSSECRFWPAMSRDGDVLTGGLTERARIGDCDVTLFNTLTLDFTSPTTLAGEERTRIEPDVRGCLTPCTIGYAIRGERDPTLDVSFGCF